MKRLKKVLSILMVISMLVSMTPVYAADIEGEHDHDHDHIITDGNATKAECSCGTDDSLYHATSCAAYVAPEKPECKCVEKCTESNEWCAVCGIDYTACTGGADEGAAYSGSYTDEKGISYTYNSENRTAVVTGYTGSGVELHLLPTVTIEEAEYPITGIGAKAFENCTQLTVVVLPASVTSIGAGAFAGCTGLEIVGFGGGVPTHIADDAIPSQLHLLTVTNGDGSGYYAAGQSIYLRPDLPTGKILSGWTLNGENAALPEPTESGGYPYTTTGATATVTFVITEDETAKKYTVHWVNYADDEYFKDYAVGAEITLPTYSEFDATMRRSCHDIIGWECSVEGIHVGDSMPAQELTFTAIYALTKHVGTATATNNHDGTHDGVWNCCKLTVDDEAHILTEGESGCAACDYEVYDLWVQDYPDEELRQVTSDKLSGDTWEYDPASNTLKATDNPMTMTQLKSGGDLNIALKDDSISLGSAQIGTLDIGGKLTVADPLYRQIAIGDSYTIGDPAGSTAVLTVGNSTLFFGEIENTSSDLTLIEGYQFIFVYNAHIKHVGEGAVIDPGVEIYCWDAGGNKTLHTHDDESGKSGYTNITWDTHDRIIECPDCPIGYKTILADDEAHQVDPATGQCPCGEKFVASVTISGTTNYYSNLANALSAVQDCTAADNATVTLLDSVSGTVTINGGVFTLDLNGKTLASDEQSALEILELHDGTVTIVGSGAISGGSTKSSASAVRVNGGSLTIAGGSITGMIRGVKITGGKLFVTGGEISSQGRKESAGIHVEGGTVSISGGSVRDNYALRIDGGSVSITGGSITGGKYGVYVAEIATGAEVTISGGSITNTKDSSTASAICAYGGTVTIIGGSITGGSNDLYVSSELSAGSEAITLGLNESGTGASFPGGIKVHMDEDKGGPTLASYLDDGAAYWQNGKMITPDVTATEITGDVSILATCVHTDSQGNSAFDETGTCSFCNKQFEASYTTSDGMAYDTLANALADVVSGGTVTLLNHVTDFYTTNANINKTMTLELNGKTVSSNNTRYPIIHVGETGDLTIQDSSSAKTGLLESTAYPAVLLYYDGGKLTVLSGTVSGTAAISAYAKTTVSIRGGTIRGTGGRTSAAISISGGTNLTIAGCTITSENGYGIDGSWDDTVKLTGSAAIKGGHYGILAYNLTFSGGSSTVDGGIQVLNHDGITPTGLTVESGASLVCNGTIEYYTTMGAPVPITVNGLLKVNASNYAFFENNSSTIAITVEGGVLDVTGSSIVARDKATFTIKGNSHVRLQGNIYTNTLTVEPTDYYWYCGDAAPTEGYTHSSTKKAAFVEHKTYFELFTGDHLTFNAETTTATCPHGVSFPVVASVTTTDDSTTYYTDLSTALKAATNGSTVKLLKGITTDETITLTGNDWTRILLDLNGKTVQGTHANAVFKLSDGKTVTLKNSASGGTIVTAEGWGIQVDNGDLIIEDGVIIMGADSGVNFVEGKLTVNGGSIKGLNANNGSGIAISGGIAKVNGGTITGGVSGIHANGGTVTVTNGTVLGEKYGIYAANENAIVTVDGGTLQGPYALYASGAVTLNGGTLNGRQADIVVAMPFTVGDLGSANHTLTTAPDNSNLPVLIANGAANVTVKPAWFTYVYLHNGEADNHYVIVEGDRQVNGAALGKANELYLYYCQHSVLGNNGVCDICGTEFAAMVIDGDAGSAKTEYYVTLDAAVSAANASRTDKKTILLLRDATGNVTITGDNIRLTSGGEKYALKGTITTQAQNTQLDAITIDAGGDYGVVVSAGQDIIPGHALSIESTKADIYLHEGSGIDLSQGTDESYTVLVEDLPDTAGGKRFVSTGSHASKLSSADNSYYVMTENDQTYLANRLHSVTVTLGDSDAAKDSEPNSWTAVYNGEKAHALGAWINDVGLEITLAESWWNGNTKLDGFPTDAGTYGFKLSSMYTEDGGDIPSIAGIASNAIYEGTLTITKADPTTADFVFTPPTNLVYDGQPKEATVAVAEGVVGMTEPMVSYYRDGEKVDKAIDAGTYTVKVDVGDGANYTAAADLADDSWTFTIEKAPVNHYGNGVAVTYYGKDLPLDVLFLLDENAGAATYSVTPDTGEGQLVDGSKLRPTLAGSFTITVTTAETDNFLSGSYSVTLTVNKGFPLVYPPTGLTATYGDTLADVVLPADETGTWAWVDSAAKVGSAGTRQHEAIFTHKDAGLYNTATAKVTVQVNKAVLTDVPVPLVTAPAAMAEAQTTLNKGEHYSATLLWDPEASVFDFDTEYTASFSMVPHRNYVFDKDVIAKVRATMEAEGWTVFGNENSMSFQKTFAATGSSEFTATYGDKLSAVALPEGWVWENKDAYVGDVGEQSHKALYTLRSGETVSLMIPIAVETKELSIVGVTLGEKIWDGTSEATVESVALSGILDADDVAMDLSKVTAALPGSDAGSYDSVALADIALTGADAPNYAIAPSAELPGSYAIAPKTVTADITVDASTFSYTGEAQEPTVVVKDGDTVIDESEYSVSYSDNTNVGTATITVSDKAGGNYTVNGSSTFTIEKAKLTITADSKFAYLGNYAPALTYTVTGLAQGEKLSKEPTVAYEKPPNMRVEGTTNILVSGAEASGNYIIEYVPGKLTVAIRPVEVTVKMDGIQLSGKVYDGEALTYTGSAAVTGHNLRFIYTWYNQYGYAVNAPKNAGTYTLRATVNTYGYTGYGEKSVTIEKATVTVTAEDLTANLGEELPQLTYTVTGLANGQKLRGQVAIACEADMATAGEYTITVSGGSVPDRNNYVEEIVYVDGTLTVADPNAVEEPAEEPAETPEEPSVPAMGDNTGDTSGDNAADANTGADSDNTGDDSGDTNGGDGHGKWRFPWWILLILAALGGYLWYRKRKIA